MPKKILSRDQIKRIARAFSEMDGDPQEWEATLDNADDDFLMQVKETWELMKKINSLRLKGDR